MSGLLGSKFLDEVTSRLKHNGEKVYLENRGFRMFSKFTFSALIICCGLVTLQQLIGEHIRCVLPDKEDVRPKALQQYCFIMSTYTLPHLYNDTNMTMSAHFGVGTYDKDSDQERKFHAYYQWVPFVLFFQAILFYVPHMIWKAFEGNKIKTFCNLELGDAIKMKHRKIINEVGPDGPKNKEKKEQQLSKAATCFVAYLGYNNFYAAVYAFCELLNFIIVILNIFMTDAFLGYEFSTYGHKVVGFLSEDPENRQDPMSIVFPKVTKCDFHKYGPSGNLINYDVMCVLALNIINEKIYTFLWFWFIILAIIGGLALVYRIALYAAPRLRSYMLERKMLRGDTGEYDSFADRLSYADWFVLKRISDNINGMRLGEFCASINKLLRETTPPMTPPPHYNKSLPFEDDETKQPFMNSVSS